MKNKKVVIIILAVSLLLVGTVALANFDENGNFVNPYTQELSQKVQTGEFTQGEVDTFNKVFASVHNEEAMNVKKGRGGARENMDTTAMSEYQTQIQEKVQEALAPLVTKGVITQEQYDSIVNAKRTKGQSRNNILGDLTDKQCEQVRETMTNVHQYIDELRATVQENHSSGRGMQANARKGFASEND